MRHLVSISAILLVAASSAQAADLADRTYVKSPVVAQVYDWSGFYFGANAGVGVGRDPSAINTGLFTIPRNTLSPIGAIGGLQTGFNWQSGNLVFGVETDFQASGMDDSSTCNAGCQSNSSLTPSQSLDWFGTARLRAGLASGPVFSYFTGGFAYGNVKSTVSGTTTGFAGSVAGAFPVGSVSETKTGWTIGGGIEAALGGNWTGKVEYLYLDLGNQNVTTSSGIFPIVMSVENHEHVFRAGLNYHLNGAHPYVDPPVANWAGFYAGLNAGFGVARNPTTFGIPGSATTDSFTLVPQGFLGGGQIGYNWQSENWVYGLEADFQGSALRDKDNCLLVCFQAVLPSPFITSGNVDQQLTWFGTVRGRFGYSVGSTLFYGTGGLAYGEIRNTASVVYSSAPIFFSAVPAMDRVDVRHINTGWTAGGGIESPIDWLGKNWTLKSEYLYVDLGSVNDNAVLASTAFALNSKIHEHIFRAGINYHFGP
ncbi:MAG TPA: outer membrane beta-barrel protein [Afipia sp.]